MSREVKAWLIAVPAMIAALVTAWGIVIAGGDQGSMVGGVSVFLICAIVAFGIQWVMFIHAWILRSEHYFDLTGSVTYVLVICLGVYLANRYDLGSFVLATLVIIWAGRLGPFLFLRIKKAGEDRRFKSIRNSFPTFLMTWTLQGTWVFLTLCCALAALTSSIEIPLGANFWLGLGLWTFGFVIEVVADRQKSQFRADPANADSFISTGLWAWSRHPNYFGEIVLWGGIAVIAYPALQGNQIYTLISPIWVVVLLTFISGVRMLEARADKRWGEDEDYKRYKRKTPTLMLWPPSKP
ncbi:MAG: DUF1295 domain-containing protein [Pseudomonadota bacterium]